MNAGSETMALVAQFDEEIPFRLADICRTMAERYAGSPAFAKTSREGLLDFLGGECLRLFTEHFEDFAVITGEAAVGARYTLRLTIRYDHLCCDLAAAAFDRFVLTGHSEFHP